MDDFYVRESVLMKVAIRKVEEEIRRRRYALGAIELLFDTAYSDAIRALGDEQKRAQDEG